MRKRVVVGRLGTVGIIISCVSIVLYLIGAPDLSLRARSGSDSVFQLTAPVEAASSRFDWREMLDLDPVHEQARIRPRSASHAPIRIITGPDNRFGAYYAEILRAEGLNLFALSTLETMSQEELDATDTIILTIPTVSASDVDRITSWVTAGGILLAIRPEGQLLGLAGITAGDAPALDGYIQFDSRSAAGRGVVQETLQLRVPASLYEVTTGVELAHLYDNRNMPLRRPGVILRHLGRGYVATYAYDLAESVIRTRQGNPAWINQERDGHPPRRANDLFFPDYTDMNKIGIPQADEQQRFFANLIVSLSSDRRPLPRLWYLPGGRRAAIILASDDHATKRGTVTSFNLLNKTSEPGCHVERWDCYRATSYLSPGTPMTIDQVRHFSAQGFEIGIHADTGCTDTAIDAVSAAIADQVTDYGKRQLGIQQQQTHRLHCIPWNGWVDTVRAERSHGIRFSLNYYYWPEAWVRGVQGYMTGSGIPMRFADLDGDILDIYQSATHIVDENGIDHARGIGDIVDKAIGPEQFFGMFATHYDFSDNFIQTAVRIESQKGVALISAAQALQWTDARSTSRLMNVGWVGDALRFELAIGAGASEVTVLLPLHSGSLKVTGIECDGMAKTYHPVRIKGLDYAAAALNTGRCHVKYRDSQTATSISKPL
jgi:hypothetical protein